jgi:NADPH2:quinone reductase
VGVDVVFDGVGRATFGQSLTCIHPRGLMATFGNASGPPPLLDPLQLSAGGSLYVTRPTLFDYASSPEQLRRRTAELFGWMADGRLGVTVQDTLDLATEVKEGHRRIEAGETTGKILFSVPA